MERQRGEAVAGAVAGVATTVALHPLDVIRTRFQVYDGRSASVPKYRGTAHALITIARSEGLRGLYAGLFPAIVASSLSWGVYFFFYSNAKHRYRDRTEAELGPGLHLLSAAEAGIIASAVTNPIWLVKTRLELQASGHKSHSPYKGFTDALQDIAKHEGWRGLYKGFGPSLLLVSHGALQFMAYEEGRKYAISLYHGSPDESSNTSDNLLTSRDYAVLGASSKLFAVFVTYPFQVIRSRIQQRPNNLGVPIYKNSWHAFLDTLRFESCRGLYKGIMPTVLRVLPSSSITFVVYESVKKFMWEEWR